MIRRYEFLDGLRGVAALMVVLLHFLQIIDVASGAVPHAHLAVDFFFCLSGFVLTHAYSDQLGTRLTLGSFYASRCIRLYPMLVLGLVAGTAVILIRLVMQAETEKIWNLLGASLTNLFLLPSPLFLMDSGAAWPANGPQWSLFFEFVASLAFPWLLRVGNRLLIVFMVVSGAAVVASALSGHGVDGGPLWTNWPLGLVRVAYSFTLGIFLYRLVSRTPQRKTTSSMKCVGLAGLLIVIFIVPVPGEFNGLYEAAAVLILLPMVLLHSASVTPTVDLRPLTLWLGAVSYPLYAIHATIVRIVAALIRRLDILPAWQYGIIISGAIAACLWVAWIALKKIDEPARRWLTGRLTTVAATPARLTS